ncbi:hypothetical protein HY638_05745 [Candidatus Woesearchaeota archaeon]|nr:hypothetical protein [Candidatus Woesearchaeota archaeon]
MAREGPYEIIPAEEIRGLKEEVESLKKRSEKFNADSLTESLSQLTKNMSEMMQVFKLAAEQIKEEEGSGGSYKAISEKLDKVIEQNQTIAEALVSMNDMITTDVDKLLHRMDQAEKPVKEQPKIRPKMPEAMPQPMLGPEVPRPQQVFQPGFQQFPPRQVPGMQPPPNSKPFPGPSFQPSEKLDISDLENLPEMPPLDLEEPKKGFFSKLIHKK